MTRPPFKRDAERHVTGSTTIRVTKATRQLLEQLRNTLISPVDLDELVYGLAWLQLDNLHRARPEGVWVLEADGISFLPVPGHPTGIQPSPVTGDPPPPASDLSRGAIGR